MLVIVTKSQACFDWGVGQYGLHNQKVLSGSTAFWILCGCSIDTTNGFSSTGANTVWSISCASFRVAHRALGQAKGMQNGQHCCLVCLSNMFTNVQLCSGSASQDASWRRRVAGSCQHRRPGFCFMVLPSWGTPLYIAP